MLRNKKFTWTVKKRVKKIYPSVTELMMDQTTTMLSGESTDSGFLAKAAPILMADPEQANVAGFAGAASPKEEAHFIAIPFPKNYSWQKPSEVVSEDHDIPDAMSIYNDEEATGALQVTTKRKADVAKHLGFTCNVCRNAISGFRYTCVQCSDMDLCGACEADKAHGDHYMLRIPIPKPAAEIYAVLSSIRRQLMTLEPQIESNKSVESDNIMRFMSEIKSSFGGVEGMTAIDKEADKIGKEADVFGKKANVIDKEADVFGKKADLVGKEVDEFGKEGMEADVFGKEADLVAKEADVLGKGTDIFDKETDEVGMEADLVGKKAEVILTKSDVIVKEADVVGKKAKAVRKKADVVGKKADVVGKEADAVSKKADVVGKEADAVSKKADVVGKEADAVGKKADAVGKGTDIVDMEADVAGIEADLPAPDQQQQQDKSVSAKPEAKATDLQGLDPLAAKKRRVKDVGAPKAKRAKHSDKPDDAVPSTSHEPIYGNNGRERKSRPNNKSDDKELKMMTLEAQMEFPDERWRWGSEEFVIHDRRMAVENNPYVNQVCFRAVARPLRRAAPPRSAHRSGSRSASRSASRTARRSSSHFSYRSAHRPAHRSGRRTANPPTQTTSYTNTSGPNTYSSTVTTAGRNTVASAAISSNMGRLRFVLRLPSSVLKRRPNLLV
ncbi:hypothetical protein O3G_MSEX011891 [Manduca sexta]|uniref:ZZ-type domain-containing protein n=1 Tax=Manduca sexta TaxID=7130 RepID=A0A922CW45_MANSE|nr:hypothetical protein O3G_MSEX011891 [Manduca sexta]